MHLFIASVILATLSGCINEEHDESKALCVGEIIPSFMVKANIGDKGDWRYDGGMVNISSDDFLGKTGVIVFFNTGCEDCQRELPEMQQWYDGIKGDHNYEVICISREEKEESISDYWKRNNLTLPYSAQADRKVYNLFAQTVIPRIYIINESGRITDVFTDQNSVKWPDFTVFSHLQESN